MSVADVEGIAKRPVQRGTPHLIQPADRCRIQGCLRDREQIVTADHTDLGQAIFGSTSTSERMPRIVRVIGAQVTVRSTAIAASRVSTQTGRRPAGGPRWAQYSFPALYHAGAFSAASRAAALTIAGSWGCRW
jgi:hypothetical protein